MKIIALRRLEDVRRRKTYKATGAPVNSLYSDVKICATELRGEFPANFNALKDKNLYHARETTR
eukprot:8188661-Prorocentrum_lima.AAC.1